MLLNALLTKLTAKSSWYFQSVVYIWYYRPSVLQHCTSVLQYGTPWNVFVVELSSLLHTDWSIYQRLSARLPLSPFPLLTQYMYMWRVPERLHGGSWLGWGDYQPWGSWSTCRHLDIPGIHFPYSMMQLLTEDQWQENSARYCWLDS